MIPSSLLPHRPTALYLYVTHPQLFPCKYVPAPGDCEREHKTAVSSCVNTPRARRVCHIHYHGQNIREMISNKSEGEYGTKPNEMKRSKAKNKPDKISRKITKETIDAYIFQRRAIDR